MKKLYSTGIILGILMAVAAVVMFIMNIWIPDERWAMTGLVLVFTGGFTVIGCAAMKDMAK